MVEQLSRQLKSNLVPISGLVERESYLIMRIIRLDFFVINLDNLLVAEELGAHPYT